MKIKMSTKQPVIPEGTTGLISYKADKYGKFIHRPFLWDSKCTFTEKHVIYFDTFRNNYRCAKRPIKMSANQPRKEAI